MTLTLNTPEGTTLLASALGAMLVRGDVVLLGGDLGAGKTTFAQALICSLAGADTEVTSPTFTLQHSYDLPGGIPLMHMDLYRIEHESELIELGLDDAFDTAISLIEWPERLGRFTPKEYLYLRLEIAQDDARIVTFAASQAWHARLKELEYALQRTESPHVTL